MKLSPESIAAVDLVIKAFARLQEQLAPLDAACDAIIETMMALKAGADDPPLGAFDRLEAASDAMASLLIAIDGLAIVAPAAAVIREGIEEYLDNA